MPNPSIPSIAQSFKAGDKLASCYTLKEQLPGQGFCVVWLAHDEELNKDIALHFVPDSVASDSRARTELKQEAKRNRQLIHPRIVRIHDLVEDEKWAAISMDHVQGETLAVLQQKRDKNAFNPSEIAAGISELCQTLEDAHRIDLLHRDLTPENLLATGNGVMVQKFGLSRVIVDSLGRNGQQVEAGRDIAYISPQQLDAERPSRTDDLYSLGASLFDLLTGGPPFAEGDVIAQIRKTVPPTVSERRSAKGIAGETVPKAWDETIAACLGKTPEERPKSAAEAGARFAAGKTGGAPASHAAVAATSAVEAATQAPAEPPQKPAEASNEPKQEEVEPKPVSDVPVQEPAGAKSQKRPWAPGPGKAPLITEATVLSKTPVPRGESKGGEANGEPANEVGKEAEPAAGGVKRGPGGPTTPSGFPLRAFVEVEGDSMAPKKSSGGLVVAGGVLAIVVIICYLFARNHGGPENATGPIAMTSGSSENQPAAAEATASPVATPAEAAAPAPSPVNVASSGTGAETTGSSVSGAVSEASTPPPANEAQASPTAAVSEASPAPQAVPVIDISSMTEAQVEQLAADKAKAIDQAKAALADAEKAAKEKADAQAQATTALQDVQATAKQKTDAAVAAKKAADDAAATLKQQQDTLQKAEADAAEAQKVAAAKAQAADQIRKTMQDAQAAVQQGQTAQQQVEADAAQLAKTVEDRQKAAEDSAKAAADAEKARQAQAQALAQAQAELGQVQAGLQKMQQNQAAEKARKAAEEAARIQKEREAETARLAAQAAAATKAAEDAQKALEAAKKAVADAEKAQHDAEMQAEAARNGTLPLATPAPSPETTPTATPAGTPPSAAAASPAPSTGGPTLSVHAQNPHMKVDQALVNSLGMRFAPVGNVFFCVWLTRVQDFEAFANATGYKGEAWRNPGFKQAPDHPVVNVSWNDANQFCLWLTEKEHRDGILAVNETYRLPTDLEWSNAVGLPPESGRTPESRDMDVPDVYPWGTQWPPPPGSGNYTGEETDSDVAIKGYNDGFAWTSPVGSFNANKFGLYDMGGNVWEWCLDWWNSEQKAKVLRGGSWYNGALKLSLLSSCRIHASADQGTDNYGFRIVLAQEMSKKKSHSATSH